MYGEWLFMSKRMEENCEARNTGPVAALPKVVEAGDMDANPEIASIRHCVSLLYHLVRQEAGGRRQAGARRQEISRLHST